MTHIRLRRHTENEWATNNPVLDEGETGWCSDALKMKLGNGIQAWNDLPWRYVGSAVTSVAGRAGAVVLTKADVGLGSVDNTSDMNKPVSTAQAASINAVAASVTALTTTVGNKVDKYTLADGTDLNSSTTSGNYRGNTLTNSPGGLTGGFWQVSSGNGSSYCVQTFQNYGGTRLFIRSNNSGAWGSWTEMAQANSPSLTGTPLAPTATAGTNNTQIATTAFVATAISGKANSASPTFTGTPVAPTALAGTTSTQLATTAFVQGEVSPSSRISLTTTGAITAGTIGYYVVGGMVYLSLDGITFASTSPGGVVNVVAAGGISAAVRPLSIIRRGLCTNALVVVRIDVGIDGSVLVSPITGTTNAATGGVVFPAGV